jgi:ABC-type glycerol-3-phosphate transport system substrate-binding protein
VRKARLLIPTCLLALLAGLVLAACGGGESAEEKIENAVETSATSTDPASCKEFETTNFIEQTNGVEEPEALEQCEEDAEEGKGNADSVEVSEVEVEGSEATATATLKGGSFDGQTVVIGLVEEGGEWKLNEFEEFKVFNAEKLLEALASRFEEEAETIEPALAECVIEGLEEFSEAELEETAIEGRENLEAVAEECNE